MISDRIPSVLTRKGYSSISTERALKQVKELLEEIEPLGPHHQDQLLASLDDVDMMLAAIDREDR
jgi:hypothetical protein